MTTQESYNRVTIKIENGLFFPYLDGKKMQCKGFNKMSAARRFATLTSHEID